MQEIFAVAQIALTLIVLIYTSYRDWKIREVSDRVWVIYGPIALALSLANFLLFAPADLPFFGLCVGVTVGFVMVLFLFGGFGGADAKAFMCIAVSLPFFPQILYKPLVADGLSPLSQLIFPVTILLNSALIAAGSGILFLVWNGVQWAKNGKPLFDGALADAAWYRKLVALVTGAKVSFHTLQEKWRGFPLEDVVEEEGTGALKRKLLILPKYEECPQILERLEKASKSGKIGDKIWGTPGLPYLIIVTVGLVVSLTLGDLVWIVVRSLLG